MAGHRLQKILRHLESDRFPSGAIQAQPTDSQSADLVFRGATIVDGNGGPAFEGDLAVKNGKIVFVGAHFSGSGAKEIKAQKRVLTPGFIDIHTHFDPQLCWDGRADPSLKHGVTTVVTGNCSLSLAPAANASEVSRIIGMFGRIEDIKKPTFEAGVPFEQWQDFASWMRFIKPNLKVNVGALVGHSVIRLHVMGEDAQKRAATPEEVQAMCEIVEAAMKAGAIGVSTSYVDVDENMKPVPSQYADLDEKVALATAMGRSGRGVWQAVPLLTPDGTVKTIRELAEISRRAGVPASFQPVLTLPFDPVREDVTKALEEEAERGARVYGQVTPRDFNMNLRLNETAMFLMGLPRWEKIMRLPGGERLPHFANPSLQPELVQDLKKRLKMSPMQFLTVGDVSHAANQKYKGRKLMDIAKEEGKEFGQALLDISVRDELNTEFRLEGVLNADKDAVAELINHPYLQVGASDAGAHITQFCGTGDTTFLLERLVKTNRTTIENAVHLMTGALARDWGIADRGTLEVGKAADLVLLDMDALWLGPMEFVHDFPGGASRYIRHARGFEAVFVNGSLVVEQNEYTDGGTCGQVV